MNAKHVVVKMIGMLSVYSHDRRHGGGVLAHARSFQRCVRADTWPTEWLQTHDSCINDERIARPSSSRWLSILAPVTCVELDRARELNRELEEDGQP